MTYAITTSAGRTYPDADQASLQSAIDSLTSGGTVWIWRDLTLTSYVTMAQGVHLDFQGHLVTPSPVPDGQATEPIFVLIQQSRCQVRNVVLVGAVGLVGTFIVVRAEVGAEVSGVLVENIRIVSEGGLVDPIEGYAGGTYRGISLSSANGGAIRANCFRRIHAEGIEYAMPH